ncbi:hypothetical protein Plhal304r1_c018g0064011 [Plasmopara halstedii]
MQYVVFSVALLNFSFTEEPFVAFVDTLLTSESKANSNAQSLTVLAPLLNTRSEFF